MKEKKSSPWKELIIPIILASLALLFVSGCGKLKTEIVHTAYLRNTEDNVGPYRVLALVVSDSQPLNVFVVYSTDNWKKAHKVKMEKISEDIYAGEIPGQPAGTTIKYFILVDDVDNEITTDPVAIKDKISDDNFKALKSKAGCSSDNPTYCFQILKKK